MRQRGLILILCCFLVSACQFGNNIKGTYIWDYNGYQQKVIINSNKDSGPCVHFFPDGSRNEAYHYWKHLYDRPQLQIDGVALIDVKNKMVYYSENDFEAYRNGTPCIHQKP